MSNGSDGYVVTYTGRMIAPLHPDPEQIVIEDIAHALSNLCRFTGHVQHFYSVSQHSVIVSEIVPHEHALAGLLHDASEAYLSDISRPVKMQAEFGDTYKKYEARLEAVIAMRFGLDWPWHDSIKAADEILLRTEQRDLMPDLLRFPGDEYLPDRIKTWSPSRAKQQFMLRYRDLTEFSRAVA